MEGPRFHPRALRRAPLPTPRWSCDACWNHSGSRSIGLSTSWPISQRKDGRPDCAVTLTAAAAELIEAVQAGSFLDVTRRRELWLADARGQVGDKRFEAVWLAGQAMSPDEAVAYARAVDPPY